MDIPLCIGVVVGWVPRSDGNALIGLSCHVELRGGFVSHWPGAYMREIGDGMGWKVVDSTDRGFIYLIIGTALGGRGLVVGA
jgi:hypothetical protein